MFQKLTRKLKIYKTLLSIFPTDQLPSQYILLLIMSSQPANFY